MSKTKADKDDLVTQAASNFLLNLDWIKHTIALHAHETDMLAKARDRLDRVATPGLGRIGQRVRASPISKQSLGRVHADLDRIARATSKFTETIKTSLARQATARLWMTVMLVTCVEAYLQDLLSTAARLDREVMGDAKPSASYVEIMKASSLEDLADEVCRAWARGWVNQGRPSDWIKRLVKMQKPAYASGIAARLEVIWSIRHVVVHSAGFATADFVRRYPRRADRVGKKLSVSLPDISEFFQACGDFVIPTDEAFCRRLPSLATKPDEKNKGVTVTTAVTASAKPDRK
jgi:hypothetical protein